jgi:hypothetical protein
VEDSLAGGRIFAAHFLYWYLKKIATPFFPFTDILKTILLLQFFFIAVVANYLVFLSKVLQDHIFIFEIENNYYISWIFIPQNFSITSDPLKVLHTSLFFFILVYFLRT